MPFKNNFKRTYFVAIILTEEKCQEKYMFWMRIDILIIKI